MKHIIEVRNRQPTDGKHVIFNSLVNAAEFLECSISTLKVGCRKKTGTFYGHNKKTGARCFFTRANHNYIISVVPAKEATPTNQITTQCIGTTAAAKFLGLSHAGLSRHLSPGDWFVRNLKNEKECFVLVHQKRNSPRR